MLKRDYSEIYVAGGWKESRATNNIEILSPTSELRIGSVPSAHKADIDAAVQSAQRAFLHSTWATRPASGRARLCRRFAELLEERSAELAEITVDEMGCPISLSKGYQAAAPVLIWNYYANLGEKYRFSELRAPGRHLPGGRTSQGLTAAGSDSLIIYEPIGVVAVFCAYNFPLPCFAQKVAPALIAGCTVVIKAPLQDPLSTFALGDLISEAGFPPGVINIVSAETDASRYLVQHPMVDMVSFTGSTAVGRQVAAMCGALIRPAVLELGGKSAAIVLEDADPDIAVPSIIRTSVGTNSGQSCVSMSRCLVPHHMYERYASALVSGLRALRVGDPRDPGTEVGPLISAGHKARVLAHIRGALAEGATVATGGGEVKGQEAGWFVEPTLLTEVRNEMAIAREEIFGPVVALIPYEGEEEAVSIANDSSYGLAGCVYTLNPKRGLDVARRVRTGTFSINTYFADINSPFGGFKQSGLGRERGVEGIEHHLLSKTVTANQATDLRQLVDGSDLRLR